MDYHVILPYEPNTAYICHITGGPGKVDLVSYFALMSMPVSQRNINGQTIIPKFRLKYWRDVIRKFDPERLNELNITPWEGILVGVGDKGGDLVWEWFHKSGRELHPPNACVVHPSEAKYHVH